MRPSESAAKDQTISPEASQRLHDKITGVKLRQARDAAGHTIADCASRLEIAPEALEAWEFGEGQPNLSQLEMLASYLNVSVSDIWQSQQSDSVVDSVTDQDEFSALRRRLVGGLLRAAREAEGVSVEQLSKTVEIDVDLLSAYELGERVIPMDQLSILAEAVERDLGYFQETEMEPNSISPYLAEWPANLEVPDEVLKLSANHKSKDLIKLAVAFSHIPSEELQRIAAALLAISAAKSRQNGA